MRTLFDGAAGASPPAHGHLLFHQTPGFAMLSHRREHFVHAPRIFVARVAIAFALLASTLVAQAGACVQPWRTRFGTTHDDQIHAAIRDDAGNVYLGGFERGTLGVEDWPVGDAKGFVEKHGADGALAWRYEFDTAGTDIVEALALDAGGRVAVAGRTSGALPGVANGGEFDLFVALLDVDGTLVSTRQLGNERSQHPVALGVAGNGDLVVVGYDEIYRVGTAVIDRENGFIGRFHVGPDGAISSTSFSTSSSRYEDALTAVAAAPDGSGDVFVSDRMVTSPSAGGGIHVRRIDPQGVVVWTRTLSQLTADYIASVVVGKSSRLYAAGATGVQIGGPLLGLSDGFIVELDPVDGAPLNAGQFGSPDGDWVYSLAIDASGELFVGGISNGSVIPGFQGNGNFVSYALTFSADLTVLGGWQEALFDVDSLVVVPSGCSGRALIAGGVTSVWGDLPAFGGADALVVSVEMLDAIFADDFDRGSRPADPSGDR